MGFVTALILAAAVPQAGIAAGPEAPRGVSVRASATAVILRAERAVQDGGEGSAHRHVRKEAGGSVTIHFE